MLKKFLKWLNDLVVAAIRLMNLLPLFVFGCIDCKRLNATGKYKLATTSSMAKLPERGALTV